MKSSVEPLEGNKVKVYVEVEEAEFDRDIDRAFKSIAREVKLPGFRNGKAPRRVLEARIGLGPAREQALRDAIPAYLAKAVREHDVDLVATPEVEITGGQEDGPVEFDATCEVRPEITVPGYGGLRVELSSVEVTEEEIDHLVSEEQRRHAGLTAVDRPAASGDFVTLDMSASRDGEDVMGLNTEDWSYEIGQGWVAEDFDEQLIDASAGDELRFTTTPKGTEEPVDFLVTVKQVQVLDLPELTDEWVADHLGEFDTVEAWREDLAERLAQGKLGQVRNQLIGKVTDALALLVDEEPPESMVNSDLQQRVQRAIEQFQSQGIDLQTWLSATGQDTDSFFDTLKVQSEKAVKIDLALRAVALAEQIEVTDEDLDAELTRISMQVNQKVKDVRRAYERNDALPELEAQLRKSKALDWLLHHVEMVDPEGHPLDRDLVLGHDHDEDHDHDGEDHHVDGEAEGEHVDNDENGDEE